MPRFGPSFLRILAFAVLCATVTRAQTSTVIQYVYDDVGRLLAVVNASGECAVYTYDAVGNLLSITRHTTGTLAILAFSPNGAPIGATVTIYGIGFSPTLAQNAVTFNGVAAAVTAGSPTSLVVTVPTGATTGLVSVVTPSGSAASATAFIVTTDGAPVITSFSPSIAAPGTSVTISGTGFQTTPSLNRLAFNVTNGDAQTAVPTSVTSLVPAAAASGRIRIATPFGSATSTDDLFVPPSPYTASQVGFTGRLTPGQPLVATLSTANKIGLVVVDGVAGQHLTITAGASSIPNTSVYLRNPLGTVVGSAGLSSTSSAFLEAPLPTLPGSYTVLIAPSNSSYTGSLTLTCTLVTDLTGTIVPGGSPVALNLNVPGQNGQLTFNGVAGQRISLTKAGLSNVSYVSIRTPDGATLLSPTLNTFVEPITLQTTGQYALLVDPASAYTGTVTLTLYDVPANITGTITPGGAAVPLNLAIPGQNAQLSFDGTVGQRISLTKAGLSNVSYVSITTPSGTTLLTPTLGTFIEPITLPTTGTYALFLDPANASTGTVTLTLYDVPPDATGGLTVGGTSVVFTTAVPGQNAIGTFVGTAGQQVTVHVTNNAYGGVTVSLIDPSGTTLTSKSGSNAFNLTTQTLASTGSYTVRIDPIGSRTGSATVSVTAP